MRQLDIATAAALQFGVLHTGSHAVEPKADLIYQGGSIVTVNELPRLPCAPDASLPWATATKR